MGEVEGVSGAASDAKLFEAGPDWWNNACLNWSHSQLNLYVAGYKEAADIIVREVMEHHRNQDVLVFPVVFLYRHYIELQLKGIIAYLHKLLDEPAEVPAGHRIDVLWGEARSLWKRADLYPEDASFIRATDLITELARCDEKSTTFRYPFERDGSRPLAGISHINLRNTAERIAEVAEVLKGMSTAIDVSLDLKWEFEQDMRP